MGGDDKLAKWRRLLSKVFRYIYIEVSNHITEKISQEYIFKLEITINNA
jgi:hypothetical protein